MTMPYPDGRQTLEEALQTEEGVAMARAVNVVNMHTSMCTRCRPLHSTEQDPRGPCDHGKALLAEAKQARKAFKNRPGARRVRPVILHR